MPDRRQLGRYVLLRELGRGGHGRVYLAYDPALERQTALKVWAAAGESALLLREAKLVAKLSHPAIVPVYDVGEQDGEVFLNMELVDGSDLTSVEAGDATGAVKRKLLRSLVGVARGIGAAHQQGIVHGDVKPSNVLVDREQRFRLTDFGVARSLADEDRGARGGTPAYLAPEQHEGEPSTPLTDQYAFALTAWEVLSGSHPVRLSSEASQESTADSGTTVHGRGLSSAPFERAKRLGPDRWPGLQHVSRGVDRALRRALSPDPAARWSSMEELADALDRALDVRRRRLWLGTSVGVGSVAVLAAAMGARTPDPCRGAGAAVEATWTANRRSELHAALASGEAEYAVRAADWAAAELDAYAEQIVAIHRESCDATLRRGQRSPLLMDRQLRCVERAGMGLDAVATVLTDRGAQAAHKVHDILDSLPSLARCDDLDALRDGTQPPMPADADAVEEARRVLAEVSANLSAGDYEASAHGVAEAKRIVAQVDYGPIHTVVAHWEGRALQEQGDFGASEEAFLRALGLAKTWRQWDELEAIAANLMWLVGNEIKKPEEALRYADLARPEEDAQPRRRAGYHSRLAGTLFELGRFDDAIANARRAVALTEEAHDADDPRAAMIRNNLGQKLAAMGKFEASQRELDRALPAMESSLGPDHPDVLMLRSNRAVLLMRRGHVAEAVEQARELVGLREGALGRDHPRVASAHNNLAAFLMKDGRPAEAEPHFRRALQIRAQQLEPDHPDLALTRGNLALSLTAQERATAAEPEARQALAALEDAVGPGDPKLGYVRTALAMSLWAQRKLGEAEQLFRANLEVEAKAFPDEHPQLGVTRTALGAVLLDRGRPGPALEQLSAAWKARGVDGVPMIERGETAYYLARAVWGTTTDPTRRREAYARLRDAMGELDPRRDDPWISEARAWMRESPR